MGTYRSETVPVLDSTLHYREAGEGRPVLLLHGNPTSSFLWRHVLARAAEADSRHRWVAPDLIGMGASGKPASAYRLADHIAYVDGFIDVLGLSGLVLVGHDWGVAIALDLARRRTGQIRGVAVMEGHLRPLAGWDAFDEAGRALFQRLRSPGEGERMVLDENFFVDTLLPAALPKGLSADDVEVYRKPFPDNRSRRPLLQWAREIPVAGDPPDVAERMAAAARHLEQADIPALLVHGQPGVLIGPADVARWRQSVRGASVVDVGGPAGHFLPEDRPEQVADALLEWVAQLP